MQTVELYYIRSKKKYLPAKFPQSIKPNGQLEYFVYGEGYKKTKAFDTIEVQIPNTKDVLQDIKETSEKYGREVCMEWLITNNAIYWQQNLYKVAVNTEITREAQALLMNAFKTTNPLLFFDWMSTCFGLIICDVVGIDKYMHEELGYKEELHGSMSDFIMNEMGQEVHAEFGKLLEIA